MRRLVVLADPRCDLGEGVGIGAKLLDQVRRLVLRAEPLAGLLDDVVAELGADRLAQLADLEVRQRRRELGHVRRGRRVEPAEVAALRAGAGVVAVLLRDGEPVGVVGREQVVHLLGLGQCRGPLLVGRHVALRRVRRQRIDEDVPSSLLRDHGAASGRR